MLTPPAPADARCAEHPERTASAVCGVCSRPVCATCALPVEPAVCRACDRRRRSLELQPPSPRATLSLAWRLYRAAFGRLLLVCAVFAPAFAAVDHFGASRGLRPLEQMQISGLAQLFVGTVVSVTAARLFLQASGGRKLDAGEALAYALRRWPAAVAATLVIGIIVGFGLILLLVPGIFFALSYCLATPLLAATRLDANEVMQVSRSLVYGKRRALLAALGAAFVASSLASLLLGLGVWEIGLMELSPASAVWVAPAQLAAEAAVMLCDLFLIAAQVACYKQLVAGSGAFQGVTETTI
ncbi:MAG: B-box zinc finger protein [Myxococcales bacterium]|jgi:hypothetical protein